MVRDLEEWRPGFYSEFRCTSREHSGLAWGAIFRKVLVLTLVPKLLCSFFQEQVPKMDSSPNIAIRKEHGDIDKYICIYIYKYIYLTWAREGRPGRGRTAGRPGRIPCKVYVCVYVWYAYVYAYVYRALISNSQPERPLGRFQLPSHFQFADWFRNVSPLLRQQN